MRVRPSRILVDAPFELHHQRCQTDANLHVREVPANAGSRTEGKGEDKLLEVLALGIGDVGMAGDPALGDVVERLVEKALVPLEVVERRRDGYVARNKVSGDHLAFASGPAWQAKADRWQEPKRFVETRAQILVVLKLGVGSDGLRRLGEASDETLVQHLLYARVSGQLEHGIGERDLGGVVTCTAFQ